MTFLSFLLAFLFSVAATAVVRKIALRARIVDQPRGDRKLHGRAVPLLGGAAIFASFAAVALLLWAFGYLPGAHIKTKFVFGMVAAVGLLAVGGALDDIFDLPPRRQVVWPALATLVVIASGIGVSYVTNPFGGLVELDRYSFDVLWFGGLPYRLTLLADVFTVAWLMTMTYTTKFLDGLDGLVSGVMVIGGLVIAAVSMMREVSQPDTALLAVVIAGVFAGFLVFNVHPASIFLGEGGSTQAGFLLGTLAIISGGKIATTLLVLGLPLFDAALVVARRVASGKSPFGGDRLHLHFLLVDSGVPHRQAVLVYWFAAALFGTLTLVLRGPQKVTAIGLVASVLVAALAGLLIYNKRR